MNEPTPRDRVADAELRRALVAMVRGRVPSHEVDEIVQATLTDAFASRGAPVEPDALERWVRGIARHKVADYHRRARREVVVEPDTLASARVTDHSAHEAADLLRWAERESDRDETLDWLLREGDGEKLQTIAREEKVPAARVRQRVARLRRHFRARWAAQLAAALALAVVAFFLGRGSHPRVPVALTPPVPSAAPSVAAPSVPAPTVTPETGAVELRQFALDLCIKREWTACLDGLERAAHLDPAGDSSEVVKEARRLATAALAPKQQIVGAGSAKKPTYQAPPKKEAMPSAAF